MYDQSFIPFDKEIIMTFIFEKPQFQTAQANYKSYARARSNSASDMILYNAIRGKALDHGFTPITNQNKLANGAQPMGSYHQALLSAKYAARNNRSSSALS